MNPLVLKQLEHDFLERYPSAFEDPALVQIGKKHKMDKMVAFTKEEFSKNKFRNQSQLAESAIKVVSRSSMVSVFEKPKFKDFINDLNSIDREAFIIGLRNFLHGNEEKGFNEMLAILKQGKLAKWSLITIIGAYFKPDYHVFVKPTTTKNVLKTFEIDHIQYKPQPSWEFYQEYREIIHNMKIQVDPKLSPSNAAFCGFLMMTMDDFNKQNIA